MLGNQEIKPPKSDEATMFSEVLHPSFNTGQIGSAIMDLTGQPYQPTPKRISVEDVCGCLGMSKFSDSIDSTNGIIGITIPSWKPTLVKEDCVEARAS